MFWTVVFIGVCASLTAAPRNPPYYNDQSAVALQETRTLLQEVRHEVSNQEQEIRIFDEKLKNLDIILESVRDQLTDMSASHKEHVKGSAAALSAKIAAMETLTQGLIADIKQFRTHTQEVSAVISSHNKEINDLKAVVEQQNKNIEYLQTAMRTLADALTKEAPAVKKSTVAASSGNTYVVKAGDSLEKIAKANQTTVQAIKELNGMTNDRIIVGKMLLLPEK